jgi:hypothetical protein
MVACSSVVLWNIFCWFLSENVIAVGRGTGVLEKRDWRRPRWIPQKQTVGEPRKVNSRWAN